MSYRIEPVGPDPESWREAAEFLAGFVRDGELDADSVNGPESLAATWLRRFRWWWRDNPFCREESPRGFLLRTPEGDIGGFQGLIPRDYQIQGQPLAGLITTTLFVRKEHRSASLGLFMRVQRLKSSYYLVDATPSEEMCAILEKFGYRASNRLRCRILPLWRGLLPWPEGKLTPGRLIKRPGDARSVIPLEDGLIRPLVNLDTLHWECQSGGATQHFRGWVDENGALTAWVRFEESKVKGVPFWRVAAYGDSPSHKAEDLVQTLIRHPRQAGLPRNVRFIAFYQDAREPVSKPWLTRTIRTRRYDFHAGEAERFWVLRDGDSAFL